MAYRPKRLGPIKSVLLIQPWKTSAEVCTKIKSSCKNVPWHLNPLFLSRAHAQSQLIHSSKEVNWITFFEFKWAYIYFKLFLRSISPPLFAHDRKEILFIENVFISLNHRLLKNLRWSVFPFNLVTIRVSHCEICAYFWTTPYF